MKVLMITGDRHFGPGNPRFELQASAVEELAVVYWGRGTYWPRIEGDFDVVTAQDPFWRGLFGWRVARRLGARFNVQVHADLAGQSFIKRVGARFVLRRADSIRVVSTKIQQQVTDMGVRAQIQVLPIYIDISKFKTTIRRAHEIKTILWVGRFETEKNPLGALKVLRGVMHKEPSVRLVMLGAGNLEGPLKDAAHGLSVEFPGWQDPVPYLETADVVLCTSWHESFGASIIEALAAGVPVVAPDVGVAKEAGAMVAPRDELAHAVNAVLEKKSEGRLLLDMPNAEEWKDQWQKTL